MFNVLNCILINTLLFVFVTTYDISLQNDDAYIFDNSYENQEDYNGVDFHYNINEFYHTSKHVFYWLYTRDNPDGQQLNRSEPHMIESTTFNVDDPIKVIVHGWMGTTQEKEGLCSYNVKSYLKAGSINVICVDWKQYSTDLTYAVAKARAKHIGKDIANVLLRITDNMTEGVDGLHLIGHSMGAHIVGFTGKNLAFEEIPRITGLDPARPLYENNDPEDRLDQTDAQFVDIIHTNGDQNGIFKSLGQIDFFPNGGKRQPDCGKTDKATGSCSHMKSYHYFAHSILSKEDYVAVKCSSWDDYQENKCNDPENASTFMGEHVDAKQTGDFYLKAFVENP